jgi:hypothetical protein
MIDIYSRVPINKTAAVVTAQHGCCDDSDIDANDLKYLKLRLERKQRLLKSMLGVRNKRHHKNIIARHDKRIAIGAHSPRAIQDYKRNGEALQIIHVRLHELRES